MPFSLLGSRCISRILTCKKVEFDNKQEGDSGINLTTEKSVELKEETELKQENCKKVDLSKFWNRVVTLLSKVFKVSGADPNW